ERLQARLAALPGVEHAALSWQLPLLGFPIRGRFVMEGQPAPPPGEGPVLSINRVTSGYFDTLGMRLIEGRNFTAADTTNSSSIVIMNEAMARRFWPGQSAVGKRFGHLDSNSKISWRRSVGVVSDVRFAATLLSEPETRYQMYELLRQQPGDGAAITLRGAVPPETLENAVRHAVAEIDPDQPVRNLQPASKAVERGLASFSLIGSILVCFASLGLLLAAVGIYGLMSYTVTQSTREFGIRMALGARRGDILKLVIGHGMLLAISGVVIGLAGAVAVTRLLAAAVPALSARDP